MLGLEIQFISWLGTKNKFQVLSSSLLVSIVLQPLLMELVDYGMFGWENVWRSLKVITIRFLIYALTAQEQD